MNLDPTLIMLSLIPSGLGFVLFVYGKKQGRWAHMAAGIAFSIYPYFVNTVLEMLLVGLLIGGAWWWGLQNGW